MKKYQSQKKNITYFEEAKGQMRGLNGDKPLSGGKKRANTVQTTKTKDDLR